ncbi:hypothetical protein ACWELP_25675 [Rhodococcus aetherivorans]
MAMTLIDDTYRILDVAPEGDAVRIRPDDSQAFERAHLRAPAAGRRRRLPPEPPTDGDGAEHLGEREARACDSSPSPRTGSAGSPQPCATATSGSADSARLPAPTSSR